MGFIVLEDQHNRAVAGEDIALPRSPQDVQYRSFMRTALLRGVGWMLSAGEVAIAEVQSTGTATQLDYRDPSFLRRLLCTGTRHARIECSCCCCIVQNIAKAKPNKAKKGVVS